uniref:PB1-like domain-containing protein n=1 Tax=Oryza rufipogon TaxID=4529 RepID=A0A0E0PNC1_ORYRU
MKLRMDPLEYLPVRFHFGGDFINNGRETFYIGGSEGMSYIERDKVSLPEIVRHLKDHCEVIPGMLLQWLFPGKELADGLRVLIDDEVCNYMSNCVGEGGVADIYVETVMAEGSSESGSKEDSDFEDELQDISPADDEWDDEEDEDLFELNTGKEVLVIVSTPEKTKRDLEQVRAFRTPDKEKAMPPPIAAVGGSALTEAADNGSATSGPSTDGSILGGAAADKVHPCRVGDGERGESQWPPTSASATTADIHHRHHRGEQRILIERREEN